MYINHRQNNWSKWLATAEFTFNNKVYTATKESPFKVNYGRELRMGFNIRKKGKNVKAEKFVKKMKYRHEEAKAALIKGILLPALLLKGFCFIKVTILWREYAIFLALPARTLLVLNKDTRMKLPSYNYVSAS